MKKRVNWILRTDSFVTVVEENKLCDYIPGKELILIEADAKNKIDIAKRIYERISKEYTMIIDFKKEICTFVFSNEDRCSFDIKASFQETKTGMVLKYSLDDEIKEIDISWTDERKI